MPASPKVGEDFAAHHLESVIGRGGMGVVYLAEQTRLKRKVALKLLPPELAEDKDFRERFNRESEMAASIEHPNIVPIYEAGEADGLLYISMRYIPGSDLKTLIEKEGPLDLDRTVALLDQVASALDDAHERDLVHRDVKPQNILVQKRAGRRAGEQAYLTDFGLTKHRESRTMTKAGSIVGTIDYMSPEALGAKEVDRRADVYSLGCVFYECLTGVVPYQKDSDVSAITAHLYEDPPALSQVRPGLPHDLDYVIGSALAKNADDRYATCGELIEVARQVMINQPSYKGDGYGAEEAYDAAQYAGGQYDASQWDQGQYQAPAGYDTGQTVVPPAASGAMGTQEQQGWGGSQQWPGPGQQTSDPTQQSQQQTSDPTQRQWSDPSQRSQQQTSDPSQQQWSDPSQQQGWTQPQQGAWSDPSRQAWPQPVPPSQKKKIPPAAIIGGAAALVLIAILAVVLLAGGGDKKKEEDGPPPVASDFPGKTQTTFSGDAAALLPDSVAGFTHDGGDITRTACAPGETSKANGFYFPDDASGGDSAELFICFFENAQQARSDLDRSLGAQQSQGLEVSEDNKPVVDENGQQVGTATFMTNPNPKANDFAEIIMWTNGNLSAAFASTEADTVKPFMSALPF